MLANEVSPYVPGHGLSKSVIHYIYCVPALYVLLCSTSVALNTKVLPKALEILGIYGRDIPHSLGEEFRSNFRFVQVWNSHDLCSLSTRFMSTHYLENLMSD